MFEPRARRRPLFDLSGFISGDREATTPSDEAGSIDEVSTLRRRLRSALLQLPLLLRSLLRLLRHAALLANELVATFELVQSRFAHALHFDLLQRDEKNSISAQRNVYAAL